MKTKYIMAALLASSVLGAAGYGLYTLGLRRGGTPAPATPAAEPAAAGQGLPQSMAEGEEATRRHLSAGLQAGDTDPATGSRILYYHDPMVPAARFDKPAKSPFMDMMLVPVYAPGGADPGRVIISPRIQQNLGVRTALVAEGLLSPQLSAAGSIAFNERDQATVQARAAGYVERLHVRATLDRVRKGQALVELYVPDWVAAQEEFLAVRRMQGHDLASLVEGARQRMRQAGMSDTQIRQVEASGRAQARITLTAPLDGVVVELLAREGMAVMPGATLFRINGLATVWANAEVPESQSALLQPGASVRARSPAAPGVTFEGKVQAILPEVNPATRTLKARLELANPGGRLVPGMFVTMEFTGPATGKALLVPTEAVIQTGRRTVVMLAEEGGRFQPVEVEAGMESGGQTEIRRGLQAGQRVVVSSQFLIDSEASLKGVEARLNAAPVLAPAAPSAAPRHESDARVETVGKDMLTLSHGPIPALKWGAMTMDFKAPTTQALPPGLKAGDRVGFEFYIDADGLPQLTKLTRVSPLSPSAGMAGSKK
ncbi:MAG: secretion protein HlyD [Polaromonas sp.]|nr:secretion protein HlyD [Polaromonas sp.]